MQVNDAARGVLHLLRLVGQAFQGYRLLHVLRLVAHTCHVCVVLLLPLVSIVRLLTLVSRMRHALLVVVGRLLTELLHARPTCGHVSEAAASRSVVLSCRCSGSILRGRRGRGRVPGHLVHGTILL